MHSSSRSMARFANSRMLAAHAALPRPSQVGHVISAKPLRQGGPLAHPGYWTTVKVALAGAALLPWSVCKAPAGSELT